MTPHLRFRRFSAHCLYLAGLVMLCGLCNQVLASSSDLLIVLDQDGQGYTLQHTLSADERTINISIPGNLVVLGVQFLGPDYQTLAEQYAASPDKISLSSGVVVIRYQYHLSSELQRTVNNQFELTLLPLPVQVDFGSESLRTQSITWLIPADMELIEFQDSNHEGSWRKDGNVLQFQSESSVFSQQIITYRIKDQDNDGTTDSLDRCSDTPPEFPVDANGCTLDTDDDGIADGIDHCLDSAAGEPVDSAGCALDFDADGVANHLDQCRGSLPGRSVDKFGCEEDSDRDGVVNQLDQCNDTPDLIAVDDRGCGFDTDNDKTPDYRDICLSPARYQTVNEFGCKKSDSTIVLDGISFLTGSSHLSLDTRQILDRVASAIIHQSTLYFEVGAHTDDQGTKNNNRILSERRANSVRQYLMLRGVSPNQLIATGYGESLPLVANTYQENREQNRRIELSVVER